MNGLATAAADNGEERMIVVERRDAVINDIMIATMFGDNLYEYYVAQSDSAAARAPASMIGWYGSSCGPMAAVEFVKSLDKLGCRFCKWCQDDKPVLDF